jgi:hypothetical protein
MKKTFFLLVNFLLSHFAIAQNNDNQKHLLTSKVNTIEITSFSLTDPYLSPLPYKGLGGNYEYENRKFLNTNNDNLSSQSRGNFTGGIGLNPAQSAMLIYMGCNFGWGLYYHFRPIKNLQFLAGGLCELDFRFKYLERNVNNPANIDLATNLNLAGIARYDFRILKRNIRTQMTIESPILGCMFVPRSGASYYEMFELWNLDETIHLSSMYNKRGIKSKFMIDVPFNKCTWRIGAGYNTLKYKANDLIFKRNEISILTGFTFDIATFSGRKNVPPNNFKSTNN